MPSSSIAAANHEVEKIMKSDKEKGGTGSRGKYQHHTEKEKAEIAKKALECGIMRTISHYTKIDPERTLSPSTAGAHLESQVRSGVGQKTTGKGYNYRD